MTINKEQPVSDAMLSAGRGAWQDYKGFSEDRVLTEIYLAMKAASHPLEQQQAVSGDVVEALNKRIRHFDRCIAKAVEDDPDNRTVIGNLLAGQHALIDFRTALQEEGVERRD